MSEKKTLLKSIRDFVVSLSENDEGNESLKEVNKHDDAISLNLESILLEDNVTKIEADKFEVGEPVFIVVENEDRVKLPVNLEGYVLSDGRVLKVEEEGIISYVGEPKDEAANETENNDANKDVVAQSDSASSTPVAKKIVEAVTKEHHFSAEDMSNKDEEIESLKSQILELSKKEETPEPKAIVHNPESSVDINLSANKKESLMDFLNSVK